MLPVKLDYQRAENASAFSDRLVSLQSAHKWFGRNDFAW